MQLASSQLPDSRKPCGSMTPAMRDEVTRSPHWANAFANQRKDRRYYEIVEDTIRQGFDYRYFILRDAEGRVCAIQPYFIVDQDLLAGAGHRAKAVAAAIRRFYPRFMQMRTMMVGCAAGEGHLDAADDESRRGNAQIMVEGIRIHARKAQVALIVLKEFPAQYRAVLECFVAHGYTRIPSMPMVCLDLDYADFNDYLERGVSTRMRAHFRQDSRRWERTAPIEMMVVCDASSFVDEIYPLYLQMYERSSLRFEKITRDYLCRIGRDMPDKARFFVWRQSGKTIGFNLCLVHDDTICSEYAGFDYAVAFDVRLYFYAFRDIVSWAIANGYRRFLSGSLNYEPKRRLRFALYPLDLYVRHRSPILNVAFRFLLPLVEPTRADKHLPGFSNFSELWAGAAAVTGGAEARMAAER